MQDEKTVRRVTFKAADGVPLVGDVGGDPLRPTVVLLHGGGQTRHSWSGAMRALMLEGYHVINFDARGHGESGWSPDGLYPLKMRATHDLSSVLAGVKGPIGLVGASMGGATALVAIGEGVLRPQAAALVMVDIVPRPDSRGTARIAAFMRSHPEGFATLEEAADAVAAYNPHRPRPRDISGLQRNLRYRAGRYYWHWDPRMLDKRSMPEADEWGEKLVTCCSRVRIPTLLVRGMASDVVTDAGTEEFKRLIPSLEIFNVLGAGHMVAGDRNDVFNEGMIEFLKRHLPPGHRSAGVGRMPRSDAQP
jgi:pimeloyl-ACP methyl ester carboxylesterase